VIVSHVVWDSPSREAVGYGTLPSCAGEPIHAVPRAQLETSASAEIIGEEGGADDHLSVPLADGDLTGGHVTGVDWMNLNP
jgi:hypothetical protein